MRNFAESNDISAGPNLHSNHFSVRHRPAFAALHILSKSLVAATYARINMEDPTQQHPNAQRLISATEGFNHLFSNDIDAARKLLQQHDDPFHSLGLGVCAFLEAALGMEVCYLTLRSSFADSSTSFTIAEAYGRSHALPFIIGGGDTEANARYQAS